jgi:hypothetical protein
MEGFLLKKFLLSYDENYSPKVDVEGMIGVKKKYIALVTKNRWKLCP